MPSPPDLPRDALGRWPFKWKCPDHQEINLSGCPHFWSSLTESENAPYVEKQVNTSTKWKSTLRNISEVSLIRVATCVKISKEEMNYKLNLIRITWHSCSYMSHIKNTIEINWTLKKSKKSVTLYFKLYVGW